MPIIRAYKFQIRATPGLERQLRRFSGACRWVWNEALEEQKARYARGEKYAQYESMAKWLTAWRNAPETKWLSETPIHVQQQTLKRLDKAYKRFFKKEAGFPKFKRYELFSSFRNYLL